MAHTYMIQVVGNTINDIIYGADRQKHEEEKPFSQLRRFSHAQLLNLVTTLTWCVSVCDADRQLLGRLRSRHAQAMPSLRGFHAHLGE